MTISGKHFTKFGSGNLTSSVNFFLWLVLLITLIAIFVPFLPRMPRDGIDASWQYGINQAAAQGLSFGNEILLTFGPYGCIYTRLYHPSTDWMMLAGSLCLALTYWVCLFLLMKGVHWIWILAFCFTLTCFRYSADTLLFSLPLVVGLVSFKNLFPGEGRMANNKLAPYYLALLFSPLGLLPLIKGSMLILCMAVNVLCLVYFIIKRQGIYAILCVVSPMLSMLFFWIISGQSAMTLPEYFIGMAPIISGYTESMATNGNTSEIVLFLTAAAFLLLAILIQTKTSGIEKSFLFLTWFVFLFLSFKAGFVRHDAHAIVSGTSILIAALLLPFIFKSRMIYPAILFAIIAWYQIDHHYINSSITRIGKNFITTYSKAWYGMIKRMENRNWPGKEFDAAVSSIRLKAYFPMMQGTSDIYSFNQSRLIASGNTWSPRPVFQSYAVFSPELAEVNRKHLLGNKAPENIIFRVEPIDGRIPSIEDGASWPVLLANYQPVRMTNNFLFLQKKQSISFIEDHRKLKNEKHRFGEHVLLPNTHQPVMAHIGIKQTFLGSILSFFFKPDQLQIIVEKHNGMKKQYRMIAGMAKSGFLISPLIDNTTEFAMLYGQPGYLEWKQVKSIVIAPRDGKSWLWNNEYDVTFSILKPNPLMDISTIDGLFDTILDSLPIGYTEATIAHCDGSIDIVNDVYPAPEKAESVESMSVEGWAAYSAKDGLAADDIFITLKNPDGNTKFITTHRKSRLDVNEAYKQPAMPDAGYTANIKVSLLKGEYFIGLAIGYKGKLVQCSQYKIPVKFGMVQ